MRFRIGFNLLGRSLSARVLWVVVAVILVMEILILMPTVARERQVWLWDRITQAHLAAFSISIAAQNGHGGIADPATQAELLKLSGTESIKLLGPGDKNLMLAVAGPVTPDRWIDLGAETMLGGMARADLAVLGLGGQHIWLTAPSPLEKNIVVQVIISGTALGAHLRQYALHIAGLSVLVALITGLLVFAALDQLLWRQLRMMTASIIHFRQDPEQGGQIDLGWLSRRQEDEISAAARELGVMAEELRGALWRDARLAAVGTAVAKISHDLRNILSSALLVADRLQETSDPAVMRAARTLISAVERAAAMVSRTVDFAREGPPPISRLPVRLCELVEEVIGAVSAEAPELEVRNLVPGDMVLPLDRAQIYRVLVNLLSNAAQAGAGMVIFGVERMDGVISLFVKDNGPGLPALVKENLFQPFTGSGRRGGTGLGLAIARDLVRAHGGDLALRRTGPGGTEFVLGLAMSELAAA